MPENEILQSALDDILSRLRTIEEKQANDDLKDNDVQTELERIRIIISENANGELLEQIDTRLNNIESTMSKLQTAELIALTEALAEVNAEDVKPQRSNFLKRKLW